MEDHFLHVAKTESKTKTGAKNQTTSNPSCKRKMKEAVIFTPRNIVDKNKTREMYATPDKPSTFLKQIRCLLFAFFIKRQITSMNEREREREREKEKERKRERERKKTRERGKKHHQQAYALKLNDC